MSLTIKNYKKLEGWAHNYKDLRIGEVGETADNYIFRVAYNSTPYTIKIFRTKLITNEYEMVLRDGADVTQFGREWINFRSLKSFELTTLIFEALIVKCKPKAQQTTGNTNFNTPF
jgi:hypothetical protein